jgi:hypothetical protein
VLRLYSIRQAIATTLTIRSVRGAFQSQRRAVVAERNGLRIGWLPFHVCCESRHRSSEVVRNYDVERNPGFLQSSGRSAAFGQQRVVSTHQREDSDRSLVFERDRQFHRLPGDLAGESSARGGTRIIALRAAAVRRERARCRKPSPGVHDDWLLDCALGTVVLEVGTGATYHHPDVAAPP